MIFQELIDQAMQIAAGVGADASASPLADSAFTAEELFPHAMRYVFKKRLASGLTNLQDLVKTSTIVITTGSGAIPSTVLKSYWKEARISGRPYATYLEPTDFERYKYDNTGQCDYFTFEGDTIYFKEAGTASFSGNVKLVIPQIPALPVSISDPLTTSDEINKDCIVVLASALRGEIPLEQLTGI